MTETKAELEERAAALEAENEQLRGQLATAGVGRVVQPAPRRPWLSEGERQELAMYGETNSPFTGERLTTEGVRAELAKDPRASRVEIPDADQSVARAAVPRPARDRQPIDGVDFVYPSVAPGQLADDATR